MKYIDTEKTIIKSWCNNPEDGAVDQAKHLANLPFVYKQVCLMPDTHSGYGMPIGGVIGTQMNIVPNAVGVDIGCGMLAVKTDLSGLDTEQLKTIMGNIRETIPVGFEHHKEIQDSFFVPKCIDEPVVTQEYERAHYQVGTLGGGNHFLEIQADEEQNIWFMIHSGSRNVGLKIANQYNKIAKELNEKWFSSVDKSWDLAFLPIGTDEAEAYFAAMNWCLEFAKMNRQLMSERVKVAFNNVLKTDFVEEINIHHNYATWENHFGKNLIVHRKGATSAKANELGIIPGSQGTHSYIVTGLGNEQSFWSCSHGAGRRMGRKEAQRTLSLEDEQRKMAGIIHSVRNTSDLDEAPGAYKDIDVVMEEQTDLVAIRTKLVPLAVIKG